MDLSETLKALADPNRLRILHLLGTQTLCVCDLEEVLKLNQSNLSRHLAKLKHVGLVSSHKKGLFMYYSRNAVPGSYGPIVENLYQTMEDDSQWEDDRQQLAVRRQNYSDGCR